MGVVTPLRSDFRMAVHDNVTQRLRLRVIIKARAEAGGKGGARPVDILVRVAARPCVAGVFGQGLQGAVRGRISRGWIRRARLRRFL